MQEEAKDENGNAVVTVGADRLQEAIVSKMPQGRETKCLWSQELSNEREISAQKLIRKTKVKIIGVYA